jgi:hypothetical protein
MDKKITVLKESEGTSTCSRGGGGGGHSWTPSWDRWIQFMSSCIISFRAVLIIDSEVHLINYFHGPDPFLRCRQLRSYSTISQHFIVPDAFVTVFTRALHRSLSWARSIQSVQPHNMSLRSILILSSYLCLPSGLFPSDFPIKILYPYLFSPCVLHALLISSSLTWSFYLYLGEEYKLWSSSLCTFLQ